MQLVVARATFDAWQLCSGLVLAGEANRALAQCVAAASSSCRIGVSLSCEPRLEKAADCVHCGRLHLEPRRVERQACSVGVGELGDREHTRRGHAHGLLARGRATHTEVHAAFGRYDDRARPLLRSFAAMPNGPFGGSGGTTSLGADDDDAVVVAAAAAAAVAAAAVAGAGAAASAGVVVEDPKRSDGLVDIIPDEEDVWLLSLRCDRMIRDAGYRK